jgi:predicted GH43/DUF377 family glycosyl hydrolase
MRSACKYIYHIIFCFFLLFIPFNLESKEREIDSFLAELLSGSSIVKKTQINLRDYPNAYNPSLIPYQGGYLLSFRYICRCPKKFKNDYRVDFSFIGVARLDKNFKVSEKTVQLLNITSHSSNFSLTAEDARLLNVGDRIFIIFNDIPPSNMTGKNVMYIGELIEEQGIFVLKEPAKPLIYSLATQTEKNWSPFSCGDKLYVIYSDDPRVILEVDSRTGFCQEVSRSRSNLNWDLGQIRGGTPAYLVDNSFLTFFHSSFPANNSKGRVYVMGAYIFDRDPPFSIRKMIFRPLGDLMDYAQANSSKKIVFPGGMVIEDNFIHAAWGRADKQIFITTFDKKKLLDSMEPCSE